MSNPDDGTATGPSRGRLSITNFILRHKKTICALTATAFSTAATTGGGTFTGGASYIASPKNFSAPVISLGVWLPTISGGFAGNRSTAILTSATRAFSRLSLYPRIRDLF